MPRLYDTLIDKNTSYTSNIHYKYFTCKKNNTIGSNVNKITKELFLTYNGILKVSSPQKIKTQKCRRIIECIIPICVS